MRTTIPGTSRVLAQDLDNTKEATCEEDMIPTTPQCKAHPDAKVLRASVPASDRSVWVCLYCGRKLGDAGPRVEPEVETQYVTPEVTGDLSK